MSQQEGQRQSSGGGEWKGGEGEGGGGTRRPQFPPQFIVSTGHTIPIGQSGPFDRGNIDPISQSGQVFFDVINKKLRIDNDWMGHRRSFIADLGMKRGYVLNDGACVTSVLTGDMVPFAVPASATREVDPSAVRSVFVEGWSNVERMATNPRDPLFTTTTVHRGGAPAADSSSSGTQQPRKTMDDESAHREYIETIFYVRNMTWVQLGDPKTTTEDIAVEYTIPWRIHTQRTTRSEIAMAPHHHWRNHERPNWRFFGEEEVEGWGDELERKEPASGRQITRMLHDVRVTTDFFNFVPMVPDPSVFEPPAQCDVHTDAPTGGSFAQAVKMEEIMCSLIEVSFNNQRGIRLMHELYTYTHTRRLPPVEGAAAAAAANNAERASSSSSRTSSPSGTGPDRTDSLKQTTTEAVEEEGIVAAGNAPKEEEIEQIEATDAKREAEEM